jgi:hypothetical protein
LGLIRASICAANCAPVPVSRDPLILAPAQAKGHTGEPGVALVSALLLSGRQSRHQTSVRAAGVVLARKQRVRGHGTVMVHTKLV